MRFSYDNRAELDEQHIHDSDFEGYQYDYEDRNIKILCIDRFNRRKISLTFNNVIFSEMQSCLFWGGGNNIYHMWHEENSPQMQRLLEYQKSENLDSEYLMGDVKYLEVQMQILSGDMLFIICESLDWTEEPL